MKTKDTENKKAKSPAKSKKTAEKKAKTSPDKETTEVAKTEDKTPAKKEKKQKVQKVKIPSLFKKFYTEKKLQKKIFKHIYIPEDKKFLQNLLVESKNKKDQKVYSIPPQTMLTKKDADKLKLLASEIKKQKGRIRLVPLIATICFIAAAIICITLVKNKVLRNIITETCETIFEAKCDIEDLNISFMDSSLKIKNLEIANKKSPMKNLVSIEYIAVDFDLLQLSKARFVADELAVEGVATNTDRKYSGDISEKLRAKAEKKKQKAAEKAAKGDSAFMALIKSKSDDAVATVTKAVQELFNEYNPEIVLKNCYDNLETPVSAKNAQDELKVLLAKYQAKPAEIQGKIDEVKEIIDAASKININDMKTDYTKILEAVDVIQNAYDESKSLESYIKKSVSGIQDDYNTVVNLANNLEKALEHDKKLAGETINKYRSLTVDDGIKFITATFDSVCYQLLGKYYPYAKQGVNYLIANKNSSNGKQKKEKVKSTVRERAPGRTVYYKEDNTPKFWIKRIAGSGTNFSFEALNITNNMDAINNPSTCNVNFTYKDIDHKADFIVDTRSQSTLPIVTAAYDCNNLPLSYSADNFQNAVGLPSIKTNSRLDFELKVFENEGFNIKGKAKFSDMKLTVKPFEPEFVSDIYSHVLGNINSMELGMNAGYTVSGGIDLGLTTDADKQVINALKKEMMAQLENLKVQAEQVIFEKISELSNGATADIKSFEDLKAKIDEYENYAAKLSKELENKLNETQNYIQKAAEKAVDDAKKQAEKAVEDTKKQVEKTAEDAKKQAEKKAEQAAEEAKKQAENAVKNAAKNAFKGLF